MLKTTDNPIAALESVPEVQQRIDRAAEGFAIPECDLWQHKTV